MLDARASFVLFGVDLEFFSYRPSLEQSCNCDLAFILSATGEAYFRNYMCRRSTQRTEARIASNQHNPSPRP